MIVVQITAIPVLDQGLLLSYGERGGDFPLGQPSPSSLHRAGQAGILMYFCLKKLLLLFFRPSSGFAALCFIVLEHFRVQDTAPFHGGVCWMLDWQD